MDETKSAVLRNNSGNKPSNEIRSLVLKTYPGFVNDHLNPFQISEKFSDRHLQKSIFSAYIFFPVDRKNPSLHTSHPIMVYPNPTDGKLFFKL
jgi:hypothetical protein